LSFDGGEELPEGFDIRALVHQEDAVKAIHGLLEGVKVPIVTGDDLQAARPRGDLGGIAVNTRAEAPLSRS
jgi:hypothetical protein